MLSGGKAIAPIAIALGELSREYTRLSELSFAHVPARPFLSTGEWSMSTPCLAAGIIGIVLIWTISIATLIYVVRIEK